ncbi:MAG TPA: zinc-binding dehydrogenase, partial [Acidimicrobiales bacterium]|nr:zinc-binding dehydrogenase [Acidimicrobiales bacterium]
MVVHPSQVVEVPDGLTDEQAVIVEPLACAVHAARQVAPGRVAVIGAGTLGLLTVAALGRLSPATEVLATAKHPEQRAWARELGADAVCGPGELARAVRSATGSMVIGDQLTGGVPTVVDCVGSEASLQQALHVVAPAGTVLTVGMPGRTTLDLTSLWHRETALRGCYAYERDDFEAALALAADLDLGRLVTTSYPLDRYEAAVDHAAHAGERGAVKIAFDPRTARRARR